MKKIIYIITLSELGGAQENVFDLAMGLKEKYRVLVAAGPNGGGKLFKKLADNKIGFKRLKWLRRSAGNPLVDIMGFFEILFFLMQERPDIVHLHSSKAGFIGSLAAKLTDAKVIYTVHGAVFEAAFSRPAKKLFLWLEKLSAYFKNKIICVSLNDKRLWLKYKAAPEDKLAVVRNCVNLNAHFLSKPEAKEALAGESANFFEAMQSAGNNAKTIGSIANFFPEKGLPYLIEAADLLINHEKRDDLIFAVMGDGQQRLLLEEILKKRGLADKFILTGCIADPRRYLKAFDIFVLPSVKEGLPYAILWAMAAGLPIVASRVGGIPEMIADGKNGWLIAPRDADGLAKKISELLDNPTLSQKFSQNSLRKVREFSLEKMITETEKIYWQVIEA